MPTRKGRRPLFGDHEFDWVIVGAGYAGLAAARALATQNPSASIAVIEAGEVGENASGRNSGFAIDLPHASAVSEKSIEEGRSAIRIGRYALDELNRLIIEHRIDCDWERRGRYHAAVTPAVADSALTTYASNLDAWGEPYEWLTRSELEARLGTRYYGDAIYTPGTYLLNPAALVRGLADSLPTNVKLFEQSPVTEVEFTGQSPYVKTARGRVRFGKLILAVNAFSQSFGVYKERQIPVLLFASLSRRLSDEQIVKMGGDSSWGITPAHGVAGSTVRFTRDKRLMIRQGFEHSPTLRTTDSRRELARKTHERLLSRRFPQLGKH
ncbi:NAD(P)/FAD-dependent oxidoreductase [Burkholderia cenocepacia]|uniref:NAD(P)/FAD-dependent oxidoreductase n=1 Tax=Burkholderia cenocepacia TaxID=95486 RepID=UPI002B254A2F|nr:FAD-binding oxidoreductase [Burkholderia cenocepacia]MEB2543741.1 FAD-binding oxidoreductase [Burkholderia cenocepacia]